jgi:hypothetical protein
MSQPFVIPNLLLKNKDEERDIAEKLLPEDSSRNHRFSLCCNMI